MFIRKYESKLEFLARGAGRARTKIKHGGMGGGKDIS